MEVCATMNSRQILDELLRCYSCLFEIYGFKVISKDGNSLFVKIIAKNDTTGIKIYYEYRDNIIILILYRLIEGKMIDTDYNNICNYKEKISSCDLNFIIRSKNEADIIRSAHEYSYFGSDNWLTTYFENSYQILIQYAEGVLLGDFSDFEKISENVINHYKKIL